MGQSATSCWIPEQLLEVFPVKSGVCPVTSGCSCIPRCRVKVRSAQPLEHSPDHWAQVQKRVSAQRLSHSEISMAFFGSQMAPPSVGSCCMMRWRVRLPWQLLQSPQSSHSLQRQSLATSMGQAPKLQPRTKLRFPLHKVPPFAEACSTFLLLTCCPSPQLEEHSPHLDHSVSSQFFTSFTGPHARGIASPAAGLQSATSVRLCLPQLLPLPCANAAMRRTRCRMPWQGLLQGDH
mmetsp:Transcript_55307/g.120960  ORF Transcript_55307/g.120960 Transcript_55307/m.120960 type:complete len:235 (-) Transcript_55307:422-1126(-)